MLTFRALAFRQSELTLNRPFYSCVLSELALIGSEAGGDLVFRQTSLLFVCKCKLVSTRSA